MNAMAGIGGENFGLKIGAEPGGERCFLLPGHGSACVSQGGQLNNARGGLGNSGKMVFQLFADIGSIGIGQLPGKLPDRVQGGEKGKKGQIDCHKAGDQDHGAGQLFWKGQTKITGFYFLQNSQILSPQSIIVL